MNPVQTLESELRYFFGDYAQPESDAKKIAVCSSGTAALHLALEVLRQEKGFFSFPDEPAYVLIPTFTMVAVARAVSLAGYVPIFVDSLPNEPNIDPVSLKATLEDLLKNNSAYQIAAVIAVSTYGRPYDVNGVCSVIQAFNAKHNVQVQLIEDLAEAHGQTPPRIFKYWFASCTSFYQNKTIYGQEGGAIVFRDYESAALARCLRSLGTLEDEGIPTYIHKPRGNNYRMSFDAAERVLQSLARKAELFSYGKEYQAEITVLLANKLGQNELPTGTQLLPIRTYPWVFDILVPSSIYTMDLVKELVKKGIPARCGFQLLSGQSEWLRSNRYFHPNAQTFASHLVYLPLMKQTHERMPNSSARFIVETFSTLVNELHKKSSQST